MFWVRRMKFCTNLSCQAMLDFLSAGVLDSTWCHMGHVAIFFRCVEKRFQVKIMESEATRELLKANCWPF